MYGKTSRFPIFKLPTVVFEHVFSNVGPVDIIEFSFCSKKCKNLIKSTKFSYSSLSLSVTNPDRIFVNLESKLPGKQLMWILKEKTFLVRRVGKRIICGVPVGVFKTGPNSMGSDSRSLSIAVTAVCQFLCELFRVPIERFRFEPANIPNFRPIVSLRNIQKLEFEGDCLPTEDFQFLLKNSNVSEELSINILPWTTSAFSNITFNCDKLIIKNAYWTHKNTLLNSNCAHIFLNQADIYYLDCEEFIEKWMNSNDNRLESVQIINRECWITLENLTKYQLKRWDAAVRGRYHPALPYSSGNPRFHPRNSKEKMIAIDCSSGFDITRNDGLMATVMYTNKQFSFVVWHNRFPNVDGLRQTHWAHI